MSRPMTAARQLSTTTKKPFTRHQRDNDSGSHGDRDAAGADDEVAVAPFVPPPGRFDRFVTARRRQQRGFVPLSPGRPKLHHRVLPRTVIGISFMLLSAGVGAAFSGAAFFAYYDNRLADNEETIARYSASFDEQFDDATAMIDNLRTGAIDDIRTELEPVAGQVTDAAGVVNLPATAGDSVWLLETSDEAGRPVSGAAFAVAAHEEGTAFVTSFALVETSTVDPSPQLELVKGDQQVPAELWAWDEQLDLAVVVIDEHVDPLDLADDETQVATVGSRIFALSGVGGQGATAAPGTLLDHSSDGLQHTVPVGALFRGAPLLTGDGQVIGVATVDYQPYGIDQGTVAQAPDITDLCTSILDCPED